MFLMSIKAVQAQPLMLLDHSQTAKDVIQTAAYGG